MTTDMRKAAAELQDLLERFAALSECATRACDTGDSTALGAALDARDLVNGRAGSLARELAQQRRATTGKAAREAFDAVLAPVRAAAALAEGRNDELARQARNARTAIGEQLDRLRHDAAARSAYAATAERGERPRLDLTR